MVDPQAISNIVEYRSGKRIGLLKYHSHSSSEQHDVHPRRIDILAVQLNAAVDSNPWDHIIHSIQSTEQGGFSAAGRSYEGRNEVRGNFQRYRLQGERFAIVEVEFLDAHLHLR